MNTLRAAAAWRTPLLDLTSTTALPLMYSTRATRGFILSPASRSLAPRPDHCAGLFSLEELLVEADPGEGVPRAISSPCHQIRQNCASCPTLSLKQAPATGMMTEIPPTLTPAAGSRPARSRASRLVRTMEPSVMTSGCLQHPQRDTPVMCVSRRLCCEGTEVWRSVVCDWGVHACLPTCAHSRGPAVWLCACRPRAAPHPITVDE